MKIIRSINKDSHTRATALTLALIKCEVSSRAGLIRDKEASNPFYNEDFDDGLLFCEYHRRADLKEKVWHGNVTDLKTDTVFCFEGATLAEVRLACVRVVKNRFAAQEEQEKPTPAKALTQPTAGRCLVWNDHFKHCEAKMIVSISPSAYAYVAADGSMHKHAERITTSRAKLACIWSSQRAHRKPVVNWGRHQQWIR